MRIIHTSALVSVLLLTGCKSTMESKAVEDNTGKAVAQMQREQVANPATSIGPNDAPVEGIDQEYATRALENLRKDQPDRSAVRRDILINIGAQQTNNNQ